MRLTFIKRLISLAAIASVGIAAHAEDLPRGQQVITAMPGLAIQGRLVPVDVTRTPQPNTGTVARAPAPPLTEMYVYAIGSTNCGWETTVGLTTTACNHGGSQLRAAVLEIGYGLNPVAWMVGGLLPSSAMYASSIVCITGGYYTTSCTPGQTVVGFMNEYTLDGYENGVFKYQNTSTNSPWNTMMVQISIL